MKIPSSINIKGHDYPIKFKWNLRDDDGSLCDGYVDRSNKIIYLDHAVKPKNRKSLFLHEILHALFVELNLAGNLLSHDLEEMIVSNLETFIVDKFELRLKK